MKLEELFKELEIEKHHFEDLHITRMFSSFVAISEGKVVGIKEHADLVWGCAPREIREIVEEGGKLYCNFQQKSLSLF